MRSPRDLDCQCSVLQLIEHGLRGDEIPSANFGLRFKQLSETVLVEVEPTLVLLRIDHHLGAVRQLALKHHLTSDDFPFEDSHAHQV
jgi:hypothetical protein